MEELLSSDWLVQLWFISCWIFSGGVSDIYCFSSRKQEISRNRKMESRRCRPENSHLFLCFIFSPSETEFLKNFTVWMKKNLSPENTWNCSKIRIRKWNCSSWWSRLIRAEDQLSLMDLVQVIWTEFSCGIKHLNSDLMSLLNLLYFFFQKHWDDEDRGFPLTMRQTHLLPGENRCGHAHRLTTQVHLRAAHVVDFTWRSDDDWGCRPTDRWEMDRQVEGIRLTSASQQPHHRVTDIQH